MLLIPKNVMFHLLQIMAITKGTVETLEEVPAHVWKGLPDCLRLGPSAVTQSRIGEYIQRSCSI